MASFLWPSPVWLHPDGLTILSYCCHPPAPPNQFWHKPLFPLDATDYAGVVCAALGLILASGGGIGGGGMLVPLYVLVMVRRFVRFGGL